ncbi:NADP-dependent oxidoreductase domain-containing protein [Aspergillus heterothallicus]
MYGVDEEVGAAIRESGIPRSELFVTSKFWPHFADPENVEICLDQCLRRLGLEYIDLFLAHWPVALEPASREALQMAVPGPGKSDAEKGMLINPETGSVVIDWQHTSENLASQAGKTGSFVPTWQAMQKLVLTGKARAIGVSNFSIADLKGILPYTNTVPISCNQLEIHPWLPNNELIAFMGEHDILATCYCPFAGQKADGKTLVTDPTVVEIARKAGMDVGQCLQSWAVQRGTVPLGKSQTESRIKSNLDVKMLSTDCFNALNNLEIPDGKGRTVGLTKDWGVRLFSN